MNGFSGLSQEVSQMLRRSLRRSTDMKSLHTCLDLAGSGVYPIGQQPVDQLGNRLLPKLSQQRNSLGRLHIPIESSRRECSQIDHPKRCETGHPRRPEKRRQDEAGSPTTALPGKNACIATHATRARSTLTKSPTSMISRRPKLTGRNRPKTDIAPWLVQSSIRLVA